MADWANSSNSRMRFYRHPSGSAPIRWFEESTCAATATLRRGDIVTFDTVVATASHRIVRAPSSGGTGTNLLQVAITSLLGIAGMTTAGFTGWIDTDSHAEGTWALRWIKADSHPIPTSKVVKI